MRLGTSIFHKSLLTCQFHSFEVLAEVTDFVPLECASENRCGPQFLFDVPVLQIWEQFTEEIFQQDDDVFVPQDAANTPAPLILQDSTDVVAVPTSQCIVDVPEPQDFQDVAVCSLQKFCKTKERDKRYPTLVTSCFLMSGLSRTWCISLGTEATRTQFSLFASSRITTFIQMKGGNALDATDWSLVMPSCVLTTSQRLHPIPSAFTEGPTACFMDGIPIGIWIPVAVCDCGLEWR